MYNKNENDFFIQNTLQSLRILYIEDEEPIRVSITKVLNYFSNFVVSISTAEEAMFKYNEYKPDIVICDISLPGISGISFVQWLREFDEKTQVILLTAHTDKEYLLEAVKLRLVDYLTKPIDFHILEKTIKNAAQKVIESKNLTVRFLSGATYCFQQCSVRYDENIYKLTVKEVMLLDYLIANKSRMIAKEELKNLLWDYDMATESAFKSLMNKLRTKIGKESIENISGVGYKIVIEENR